jgi:hypothetical protein
MYSSYAPDRRRDNGRRDDDRYEESVDEREYDRPRGKAEQVVVRSRDANRYQGALAVSRHSAMMYWLCFADVAASSAVSRPQLHAAGLRRRIGDTRTASAPATAFFVLVSPSQS